MKAFHPSRLSSPTSTIRFCTRKTFHPSLSLFFFFYKFWDLAAHQLLSMAIWLFISSKHVVTPVILLCTSLPQLDKMSDTRTPLSCTPPNLGVLALTAWACSKRNGIAEATRHPHHAEMLARKGHTDRTCKVCRAGGRKSLWGRKVLWENSRCPKCLCNYVQWQKFLFQALD